jgi:DnaJ domain
VSEARRKVRPKIDGLDVRLQPLQRRSAEALFANFGITELPQRLVRFLGQFDLTYALTQFSSEMGVGLSELLDPAQAGHERAARRLSRAVAMLLEIEAVATPGNLAPSTLVAMLSGDMPRAEEALRQFQKCNALHGLVMHTEVPFPVCEEFKSEVDALLGDWTQVSPSGMDDIAATLRSFLEVKETYESVVSDLEALFGGLKSREAGLGLLEPVVWNMAEEYQNLRNLLEQGLIAPDRGVIGLIELLESVRLVAGRLGHERPKPDSSLGATKLEEFLRILGLESGATKAEVRKAYLSMAKRYHPDLNRDPSAVDRFRAVHEAYEWLRTNDAAA